MQTSKLSAPALFGVVEAARRMKRFYYVKRSLARLIAGWEIRIPLWEIKMQLPYQLFVDTEHADQFRTRVTELRYPALDVDEDFDPALVRFMEICMDAPEWVESLAAMKLIRTEFVTNYRDYLNHTHPVGDLPSIRIVRAALAEEELLLAQLNAIVDTLLESDRQMLELQLLVLRRLMEATGGISGPSTDLTTVSIMNSLPITLVPYTRPHLPARDARFTSSVLRHEDAPTDPERLRLYRFRTLMDEMSAVEVLCGCLVDSDPTMPWAYFRDMGRWIWDESRHCEMGFEGIKSLGVDPFASDYINNYGSYAFSSPLPVVERIAVLSLLSETATVPFKIQCKEEYEETGDKRAEQMFDYDWADEAIHVTYGNRWAPVLVGNDTDLLGQTVDAVMEKWIAWGLKMAEEPEKNGTYGLFRYFHEGEWKL